MSVIEPIYNQVMIELSEEQREILALKILHANHSHDDATIPQWLKDELDEAIKDIDSGAEAGISLESAHKEIQEMLNANRSL